MTDFVDWTSLFVLGSVIIATFIAGWAVGLIHGALSERIAKVEKNGRKE